MVEFRPFGLSLVVTTPHAVLVAAVADACRGWEADDPSGTVASRPLRLTLDLADDIERHGTPTISVEGRRITIGGSGVDGWADADAGRGACRIAPERLTDARALRDDIVDPLILFLLTREGMTPIHAAGFVVDDVAVLLAGPSGSGKSCLALAAYRAGHRILSDDTVYVRRSPDLRLWGLPRPIHVFPGDAPLDPGAATRIRAGKRKQVVRIAQPGPVVTATRAALCVLRRGSQVALDRIDRDEAVRMLGPLEPGFGLLSDDIAAVVDRLTPNGAWRLTLSDDPDAAIALLGTERARLVASAVS